VSNSTNSPVKLRRFIWLFALAWAGGAVAYVPFLTILLPLRVTALAGPHSVQILGLITFCGAIGASTGNILFGWLSDRTGTRRPWVVVGMLLSTTLLVCLPLAHQPASVVIIVVCWQLALNMMLGPLSAWAADRVPARRTGSLGGLIALTPALGALSGVVVTKPNLAGPDQRLWLVGAMVCMCVLPALLFVRKSPSTAVRLSARDDVAPRSFPWLMWVARLLVQIAEAAFFAYLLLYFRSLDPALDASRVARLFGVVVVAAVPIAIALGRWADRMERPARALAGCALCSGAGLIAMSVATDVDQASVAYVAFGLATTIFLSLHSGQTLRVLPNPARRGRDLGLFNLTNTLPSMIMSVLAVTIVPHAGFPILLRVLALLVFVASALLFSVGGASERAGKQNTKLRRIAATWCNKVRQDASEA
jgi:MFS family permease